MDGAGLGFWLAVAAFLVVVAFFFCSLGVKCWRDCRKRPSQGYEPIAWGQFVGAGITSPSHHPSFTSISAT